MTAVNYKLSTADLQQIVEYEFSVFGNKVNRLNLILDAIGLSEVELKGISTTDDSTNVEITYISDGIEIVTEIDAREGELVGNSLYVLLVSLSPAMQALSNYPFSYIYTVGGELARRISVGDKDTYPIYTPRIELDDIRAYAELGYEPQYTAMRFTHVGTQRTRDTVKVSPVIVKHVIEPAADNESQGYGEIYPVLMLGNHVEFNGIIGFPHTIHNAVADTHPLPYYESLGNYISECVMLIEDNGELYINTTTGQPIE